MAFLPQPTNSNRFAERKRGDLRPFPLPISKNRITKIQYQPLPIGRCNPISCNLQSVDAVLDKPVTIFCF